MYDQDLKFIKKITTLSKKDTEQLYTYTPLKRAYAYIGVFGLSYFGIFMWSNITHNTILSFFLAILSIIIFIIIGCEMDERFNEKAYWRTINEKAINKFYYNNIFMHNDFDESHNDLICLYELARFCGQKHEADRLLQNAEKIQKAVNILTDKSLIDKMTDKEHVKVKNIYHAQLDNLTDKFYYLVKPNLPKLKQRILDCNIYNAMPDEMQKSEDRKTVNDALDSLK